MANERADPVGWRHHAIPPLLDTSLENPKSSGIPGGGYPTVRASAVGPMVLSRHCSMSTAACMDPHSGLPQAVRYLLRKFTILSRALYWSRQGARCPTPPAASSVVTWLRGHEEINRHQVAGTFLSCNTCPHTYEEAEHFYSLRPPSFPVDEAVCNK